MYCRTAFLWSEIGIYGEPGASEEDLMQAELQNDYLWEECEFRELRRLHYQRLEHDLFRSSEVAIGLWLDPDAWVSFRFDDIDPKTGESRPAKYVPDGRGMVIVLPEAEQRQVVEQPDVSMLDSSTVASNLSWVGGKLSNGDVIKEYRVPATNQRKILQAFQDAGWPELLADPLRKPSDLPDPKRLSETIRGLNESIGRKRIEFYGNGTGDHIGWRFANTKKH